MKYMRINHTREIVYSKTIEKFAHVKILCPGYG